MLQNGKSVKKQGRDDSIKQFSIQPSYTDLSCVVKKICRLGLYSELIPFSLLFAILLSLHLVTFYCLFCSVLFM